MTDKAPQGVPPWLNTFMRLVLRSPLHGMMSSKIMLVGFKGRKSGKDYLTPVSYMQTGNSVTLFTHARWWRNLLGGAPVTLWIRGKQLPATTEAVVNDQESVAEGLAAHLRQNHFDAKFYEVTYDDNGQPNAEEVRRGAESVVMVRFRTA